MVTALVDSAVIIDVLRMFPPAVAWATSQDGLGITSPVWFEVLDGARSKAELNRAVQVLVRFEQAEAVLIRGKR